MTEPPAGDEGAAEIVIPPSQQGGVWANAVIVSHSEHEFTLDFVRMDSLSVNRGIVVSRVSVSPLLITQLLDSLQENWGQYAQKALPKEVYNDEQPPGEPGAPA